MEKPFGSSTDVALLLAALLLVACGSEGAPAEDGGRRDDGGETTPCEDRCDGTTPHCDEGLGLCVPCLEDAHCESMLRCLGAAEARSCAECDVDADCGALRCVERTCVECTPATEEDDCGLFSCDPALLECTDTQRGSLTLLAPCRSDAECQLTRACVPTYFMGEPDGAHCLGVAVNCARPLTTPTEPRVSASGAEPTSYCGFDEDRVSAEAVRMFMSHEPCGSDADDSTCGDGGLCRSVRVSATEYDHRCTIPCDEPHDCAVTGLLANCNSEGYCGQPPPD